MCKFMKSADIERCSYVIERIKERYTSIKSGIDIIVFLLKKIYRK